MRVQERRRLHARQRIFIVWVMQRRQLQFVSLKIPGVERRPIPADIFRGALDQSGIRI
jgi:NAD(P)H-flavin reductase